MGLTDKEVMVLQLRGDGLTQADVAKKLKISQAAVSSFEQNARRKLLDAQQVLEFAKRMNIPVPNVPVYQRREARK